VFGLQSKKTSTGKAFGKVLY